MKLRISDSGSVILEEVFSGIALETAEGELLFVCMRDGAFEITTGSRGGRGMKSYIVNSEGVNGFGVVRE